MNDEYVKNFIVMFLSENWRMFEHYCFERGENAEEIYQYLGGERMSYLCCISPLYRWRYPDVLFHQM